MQIVYKFQCLAKSFVQLTAGQFFRSSSYKEDCMGPFCLWRCLGCPRMFVSKTLLISLLEQQIIYPSITSIIMSFDSTWLSNVFPLFILECSSGWLTNLTNPIRLQHCIPWQPLHQSGSRRLQVWLCWLSLLLLRPLPLGIGLGHPYLRPWFKCWKWTLAVYATLPCDGLWQPGWVLHKWNSE